jgi:ATP-dependent DNA helicase RecQ
VTAGWVDFWGGDRPVVILTETGAAVMRGERAVRLLLPPAEGTARGTASRSRPPGTTIVRRRGAGGDAGEIVLDAAAQRRFEALRAHRLETAQSEGVPPYVVASDRALRELAELDPTRETDLTLAHGIGEAKASRYGEGFLRVLREVRERVAGPEAPETD